MDFDRPGTNGSSDDLRAREEHASCKCSWHQGRQIRIGIAEIGCADRLLGLYQHLNDFGSPPQVLAFMAVATAPSRVSSSASATYTRPRG
jgi:hypothetical protein